MFSRFFIERPIFAGVVAIVLCLAGAVSMSVLPVQQYPTITPVQINVSASYPGADSRDAGGFCCCSSDRGADQWRRQYALHDIDKLGRRPAYVDRFTLRT